MSNAIVIVMTIKDLIIFERTKHHLISNPHHQQHHPRHRDCSQEDAGCRQRGSPGSERSHLTSTTVETERLVRKYGDDDDKKVKALGLEHLICGKCISGEANLLLEC